MVPTTWMVRKAFCGLPKASQILKVDSSPGTIPNISLDSRYCMPAEFMGTNVVFLLQGGVAGVSSAEGVAPFGRLRDLRRSKEARGRLSPTNHSRIEHRLRNLEPGFLP